MQIQLGHKCESVVSLPKSSLLGHKQGKEIAKCSNACLRPFVSGLSHIRKRSTSRAHKCIILTGALYHHIVHSVLFEGFAYLLCFALFFSLVLKKQVKCYCIGFVCSHVFPVQGTLCCFCPVANFATEL